MGLGKGFGSIGATQDSGSEVDFWFLFIQYLVEFIIVLQQIPTYITFNYSTHTATNHVISHNILPAFPVSTSGP